MSRKQTNDPEQQANKAEETKDASSQTKAEEEHEQMWEDKWHEPGRRLELLGPLATLPYRGQIEDI